MSFRIVEINALHSVLKVLQNMRKIVPKSDFSPIFLLKKFEFRAEIQELQSYKDNFFKQKV